jgi:site-specific DNA-methyltransferase (adenine-specific)
MLQTNIIYYGDCLKKLQELPDECVDLIYIDPPFNSNRNYEIFWGNRQEKRAFEDRFGAAEAYVKYMRPRIAQLYRILKSTGSFYFHCDWHASHYIKVMVLDVIFGFNNLQNEIVWYYRGAGLSKKRFARRHDTILFYTKTNKWNFYPDELRLPYAEATKERFSNYIGNVRDGKNYGEQKLHPIGNHPDDVITNIQPVAPSARARLGYPTQKPLKLIDNILLASSLPGDVVLDGFCGCGTTLVSAHNLGRKWLGVDISPLLVKSSVKD